MELRAAAALAGWQHPAAERHCQQLRAGWLPGLQTRLCRGYSAAEVGSWTALGRRRAHWMVLRVLMTVRGIQCTVTSILWCFLLNQRQWQMPMPLLPRGIMCNMQVVALRRLPNHMLETLQARPQTHALTTGCCCSLLLPFTHIMSNTASSSQPCTGMDKCARSCSDVSSRAGNECADGDQALTPPLCVCLLV